MAFPPNDGKRPSLLDLGRIATGEVQGELPSEFRDALADAKQKVPPFNAEILRSHAERIRQDEARMPVVPAPSGRRWMWAAVPLLMAAMALFVIRMPEQQVRIKGEGDAQLEWYFLDDGKPAPGRADQVVGKGDQIQFRYQAAGRENVVLVSIDGDGVVSTFYPDQGQQPVAVIPQGENTLEGSIILDNAPGPEVFIAVFGAQTVAEVRAELETTWARGQLAAIKELDEARPDIALIVLLRGD